MGDNEIPDLVVKDNPWLVDVICRGNPQVSI